MCNFVSTQIIFSLPEDTGWTILSDNNCAREDFMSGYLFWTCASEDHQTALFQRASYFKTPDSQLVQGGSAKSPPCF